MRLVEAARYSPTFSAAWVIQTWNHQALACLLDEFEADADYFRERFSRGALALTFIPNQPSAHTPFQWVVPRYSLAMQDRILSMRSRLIGSGKTGLGEYIPTPLGPRRWFAQVIAEWIPVTPTVADAVDRLPGRATVPAMVQALDAMGVTLPSSFLHRTADTVFPWSNVVTTGDDADKRRRFDGMLRKLESARFRGVSTEPIAQEWER